MNRPGRGVRAEAESLLLGMKARSTGGDFLKRVLDVKTDERAFRVARTARRGSGLDFDRLTKHDAYVLHSIPVGSRGSDIDHHVITKGGVYLRQREAAPGVKIWVRAKAVMVNGQKTDYLRNSRFSVAERVRKVLLANLGEEAGRRCPWRAVLVILTGTVLPQITIKQMPDEVLVLDRMDIPGVFKRAPERLSPEMIERVYEVARRSTTRVG